MDILVKLPSRGRPKELIKALTGAIAKASDNFHISYVLTLDDNDRATNNEAFDKVIAKIPAKIQVIRGKSTGKIHAVNRDMSRIARPWDILVLLSDDMICQQKGWDEILRNEMQENYPDLDGVLWHNDGFTEQRLNTLCILGRKYFERFNYIYHPAYVSLWCDNHFMEVADKLGKQTYFPQVLFSHQHPANIGGHVDELYRQNDKYYIKDKATYNKRKAQGFK